MGEVHDPWVDVLDVEPPSDDPGSLSAMLEGEGYAVARASSAREAVEYLRRVPTPPHLVLIDLALPDLDLAPVRRALWMQAARARLPVVVLADLAAGPPSPELMACLRKPVGRAQLLQTVCRYCGPRPDGRFSGAG
jgi:CheY-like chemotaxis protein